MTKSFGSSNMQKYWDNKYWLVKIAVSLSLLFLLFLWTVTTQVEEIWGNLRKMADSILGLGALQM